MCVHMCTCTCTYSMCWLEVLDGVGFFVGHFDLSMLRFAFKRDFLSVKIVLLLR